MLKFLDRHALWSTLRKRMKSSRGKNFLAVPYVGADATKLLPLGANDVLICALSEGNCRNGSVKPQELEKFQERGVELYLRADLHAKVCLLGRHVIIGSANLSAHSRDVLDEAALYTSDEHIVSIVKKWFEDRMSEPVSPKWLQHCKNIYKPPKDFVAKKPTRRSPSRRVWLLRTDSWDDFPEAELSTIESGEHVAAKMLGDRRRYEVQMRRWTGKPRFRDLMMPGDVIIEAHEGYVYPPGRFLHMRRSKSSRGGDVTYIYYEAIRNPSPIRWARFRGECSKMDLKLGKDVGAKEIKRMQHQDALLKMLSPDRPTG